MLKLSKKTATQLLDSHGLGPTHLVQTVNVQRHAKATPLGTALWITPTSSPSSATGDHAPGDPQFTVRAGPRVGFCFVLGFVVFGHGVNLRVNAFVNA